MQVYRLLTLFFVLASVANAGSYSNGEYDSYTPDLEMGERLFNAAACGSCHQESGADYNAEQPLLGGGLRIESPIYGTILVPNISGSTNGIGSWTRDQFLNSMLNGYSPDGGEYIPIFPFEFYAGMQPKHVIDVLEYIKTLPVSDRPSEPNQLFTSRQLFGKNPWSFSFNPDEPMHSGLGADPSDSSSWGEYLVENVSACGSCHTPRDTSFRLVLSKRYLGGPTILGERINTSIGSVELPSRNDFIHNVIGQNLTSDLSREMTGSMESMSTSLRLLETQDIDAIYQYLRGLSAPEPISISTECAAPESLVSFTGVDLTADVDSIFENKCTSCHQGANSAGNIDLTRADRVATDTRLISIGLPENSLLYRSIAGIGSGAPMPPSGNFPVSDSDRALIRDWISQMSVNTAVLEARVNEVPRNFTRDHITNQELYSIIQADLLTIESAERVSTRYLSFQNQLNGRLPCQPLSIFEEQYLEPFVAGLDKMLNSLSTERIITRARPLDAMPSVFAININDYGWSAEQWEDLIAGTAPGLAATQPYPYGENPNAASADENLRQLALLTATEVPVIRADWFVAYAGDPFQYKMMLGLPDTLGELEHSFLKIDRIQEIRNQNVIRVGLLEGESGVSNNNRVLDRVELPQGGYYWVSYDFAKPILSGNSPRLIRDRPLGPEIAFSSAVQTFRHDGGEMLFSLPNGLQGYYLTDENDRYLDRGPEDVVFSRVSIPRSAVTIENGHVCMACHTRGVIAASDGIKDVFGSGISDNIREAFDGLYRSDIEVEAAFQRDVLTYLEALKLTNGSFSQNTRLVGMEFAEPINNLAAIYFEQLTKESLAAEFGLTFSGLEEKMARLEDGSEAKAVLYQWLGELGTRGYVDRSELERRFQLINSAMHQIEARRLDNNTPSPALGEAAQTAEVTQGAAYTPTHGIEVSSLKTNVLVCEPITFTVETNVDCRLEVIYPEAQEDGTFRPVPLPQELIGDPILRVGEVREIPKKVCQTDGRCYIFRGKAPSIADVTVICVPNLAAENSVLDYVANQSYQTMNFEVSLGIIKTAAQESGASVSVPAALTFTISEDTLEEFSTNGVCNDE